MRRVLALLAAMFIGGCVAGAVDLQAQEWVEPTTLQDTVLLVGGCYAGHMGLIAAGWDIELVFDDLSEQDMIAGTVADPAYWRAEIHVDSMVIRAMDMNELRATLVHELLHIYVWKLAALAWEENERWANLEEESFVEHLSQREFWQWLCRWPGEGPL
jgi:hypothetical protein